MGWESRSTMTSTVDAPLKWTSLTPGSASNPNLIVDASWDDAIPPRNPRVIWPMRCGYFFSAGGLTMVVFVSVFFSAGGFTMVVSFFSTVVGGAVLTWASHALKKTAAAREKVPRIVNLIGYAFDVRAGESWFPSNIIATLLAPNVVV